MIKHAYTTQETADTLGLSLATVEKLIRRGEIETVQIGTARRITHRQLDAFIERAERERTIPTSDRRDD